MFDQVSKHSYSKILILYILISSLILYSLKQYNLLANQSYYLLSLLNFSIICFLALYFYDKFFKQKIKLPVEKNYELLKNGKSEKIIFYYISIVVIFAIIFVGLLFLCMAGYYVANQTIGMTISSAISFIISTILTFFNIKHINKSIKQR